MAVSLIDPVPEHRDDDLERENVEIRLLLEGIYQLYGFDFREYAAASMKRRIHKVLRAENLMTVSSLQERILHDPSAMDRFVVALTVNVSAMFRDPLFWREFRAQIVPVLRTYPLIRIWCAGCSMGEEPYSVAILLEEEGLYERTRIYATDMNETIVRKAKEGIFSMAVMQQYTTNYIMAGGKHSLADHYTAAYDHVLIDPLLKRNMVFARHNLAMDASFNEFQMILCRNAMIYFNRALQERVHGLLYDSLIVYGFLGLGSKENLRFTPHEQSYREVSAKQRIYQRVR